MAGIRFSTFVISAPKWLLYVQLQLPAYRLKDISVVVVSSDGLYVEVTTMQRKWC